MCLTHMFADLKAAGIVARHCIFEEHGPSKVEIPSSAAILVAAVKRPKGPPAVKQALGPANEINARDGPANKRNRMLPALHNFTHDVPSTNRDTRISHEIKVPRKGPTTSGKSITRDAP